MSRVPEPTKTASAGDMSADKAGTDKTAVSRQNTDGKTKGIIASNIAPANAMSDVRPPERSAPFKGVVQADGHNSKDAFRGEWPSHIQAAKNNWNKLTDSELQQVAGIESKLTELVQQRYALAQDVASKQVKSFISKCNG